MAASFSATPFTAVTITVPPPWRGSQATRRSRGVTSPLRQSPYIAVKKASLRPRVLVARWRADISAKRIRLSELLADARAREQLLEALLRDAIRHRHPPSVLEDDGVVLV